MSEFQQSRLQPTCPLSANSLYGRRILLLFLLIILFLADWHILSAQDLGPGGKEVVIAGTKPVIIDTIIISGNKTTLRKIILREMLVSEGEKVESALLDTLLSKSRENLMNTSLFNFVNINLIPLEGDKNTYAIKVSVIERWYIWPVPLLEVSDRNFNVWWEDKDFRRLSYGFYIDWKNFMGRRQELLTRFKWGYDELIELGYQAPYINRSQTIGIGAGGGFARNHEVAYITRDNKPLYYKESKGYSRSDEYAYLQFLYRRSIYNTHIFEIRYDRNTFSDSLLIKNPAYSIDGQKRLGYFTLHYRYRSDYRDYIPYPLTGYFFNFDVYWNGLGIGQKENINNFNVVTTFRKFWQFMPRLYCAVGLNSKFSNQQEQPYFMNQALGYSGDVVRSYEYYIIDGQNMGLLKTNLKYALLPRRVSNISFIKTEKFSKIYYAFYLNLFMDMGYVENRYPVAGAGNTLQNELLIGYGAGLDFVTYYDIVFRFEYSINRMNEGNFIISFTAPI